MLRLTFRHEDRHFVFPFVGGTVVIGSSSRSDLRLPIAEISRRHAALELRRGKLWIRDLGSRNGTFVDGSRVDESRLELLQPFHLGPVAGLVEEVSTTDLETGLRLAGLGPEPAPTLAATLKGAKPLDRSRAWVEAILEADGTELTLDRTARRAGARLVHLAAAEGFDGGLVIERRSDDRVDVLFAHGESSGSEASGSEASGSEASGSEGTGGIELARSQALDGASILVIRSSARAPTPPMGLRRAAEVLAPLLALLHRPDSTPDAAPAVPSPATPRSRIIGESPAIRRLLDYAHRLAPMPLHLLILGPSGGGKELLAREIHDRSDRAERPFVAINCAALPRDLLEAELFGIEEKVATGVAARAGRFEQAHGGTLFLDEVCDMALETQAMMLRVLQEKHFYRIGGDRLRAADVRVLSATNKAVSEEIEQGRFRADLYYRLAGDVLSLPPLHQRHGDVELLLYHFLERFTSELGRPVLGLSRKALDALKAHAWPGNVRQLENEARRLVALAPESGIVPWSLLSETIRQARSEDRRLLDGETTPQSDDLPSALAALERRKIEEAVAEEAGNLAAAARRLGISRPSLYQRIERLGIDLPKRDGSGRSAS